MINDQVIVKNKTKETNMNVEITINGAPASGKTSIATMLKQILERHNIQVTVIDRDDDKIEFDEQICSRNLSRLGGRLSVTIKTQQAFYGIAALKPDLTFPDLVSRELVRAREGHQPMRNPHEAYGIIMEEVDEFWDEVKRKRLNPLAALKELAQIGAMAQRAAEDLGLMANRDASFDLMKE